MRWSGSRHTIPSARQIIENEEGRNAPLLGFGDEVDSWKALVPSVVDIESDSKIMNRSKLYLQRLLFKVLTIVIIAGAMPVWASSPVAECVAQAVGKDRLVRVHEQGKRFFIADQRLAKGSIIRLVERIGTCMRDTPWGSDWSVSFFRQSDMAGYKDDAAMQKYHKDNQWAKAYLAEFNYQSGQLVFDPILKPSTMSLRMSDGSP